MSDCLSIFWIVLTAGLLLLLFFAAVSNYLRSRPSATIPDSIVPHLVPVDVEEEVLSQLTPDMQSPEHVRNAMACLRRMARNAALLQRLGYSQVSSANNLISSLAQQLVAAGVNVRLYAFVGLSKLYLARILGAHRVSPAGSVSVDVLNAYELLKTSAGNLAALKYSSWQEALAQGL